MESMDIEKVRKIFAKDRFATENGAVIEAVGEHYARCSITLTDKHLNAAGAVMGGVYFTLADFTFAVASNWEKMEMVSLSSTITYLGVVKGKKLIAEAECIKNGRTTAFYHILLTDESGGMVAEVSTTGFRKG